MGKATRKQDEGASVRIINIACISLVFDVVLTVVEQNVTARMLHAFLLVTFLALHGATAATVTATVVTAPTEITITFNESVVASACAPLQFSLNIDGVVEKPSVCSVSATDVVLAVPTLVEASYIAISYAQSSISNEFLAASTGGAAVANWEFASVSWKEWDCASDSGIFQRTTNCSISSVVTVVDALYLLGPLAGDRPIISRQGTGRLFKVESGGALVLKRLELFGGNVLHGTTVMPACTGCGGAIHIQARNTTLLLVNMTLQKHKAKIGGAIYAARGIIELDRVTILHSDGEVDREPFRICHGLVSSEMLPRTFSDGPLPKLTFFYYEGWKCNGEGDDANKMMNYTMPVELEAYTADANTIHVVFTKLLVAASLSNTPEQFKISYGSQVVDLTSSSLNTLGFDALTLPIPADSQITIQGKSHTVELLEAAEATDGNNLTLATALPAKVLSGSSLVVSGVSQTIPLAIGTAAHGGESDRLYFHASLVVGIPADATIAITSVTGKDCAITPKWVVSRVGAAVNDSYIRLADSLDILVTSVTDECQITYDAPCSLPESSLTAAADADVGSTSVNIGTELTGVVGDLCQVTYDAECNIEPKNLTGPTSTTLAGATSIPISISAVGSNDKCQMMYYSSENASAAVVLDGPGFEYGVNNIVKLTTTTSIPSGKYLDVTYAPSNVDGEFLVSDAGVSADPFSGMQVHNHV